MRNLFRLLSVLAAVSLAVAVGLIAVDFFQAQGKFPYATYIGEVNVSGLEQAEAYDKLSRLSVSGIYTPVVTFESEKQLISFSPEALGIGLDIERTVRQAFEATHSQSYLKELKERLQNGPVRSRLIFAVNEEQLRSVLETLAAELDSTPKDASLVLFEETGGYNIEPDEMGREIKINETVELFKSRLAAEEKFFPLVVEYTRPRVTEKDLRAFPPVHRLSAYTTYYGRHDSPNRIHNIKLIASWLEGTLLLSGETFSLNQVIGDITPERGFKEAYTIIGGELVPSLGGGACQIATTLFNTVSLADLKVIQRRNHSFYFNIYPLGRDATVYPGQLDFKFVNDSGHPVLIKAVATNRRLSFRLYGTTTGKTVKFSGPYVEMLESGAYRPAAVKEVLSADSPFRTTVARRVYDAAGKLLKEDVLHSYYKLYGEKSNVPIARPEPR
ncbi:MAG: VanW family protein [Candidatus Margulisbacteria bacterium]|nr:VanW family protein [Candidatus Margulisiibacteriota bacterium]